MQQQKRKTSYISTKREKNSYYNMTSISTLKLLFIERVWDL